MRPDGGHQPQPIEGSSDPLWELPLLTCGKSRDTATYALVAEF